MLGHMTSKAENWQDGEWIPKHWQRGEQLGAIDRAIAGFKTWLQDLRGLAGELEHAESNSYTEHGYEGPYGDTYAVQYPRGYTAYEDANVEDFDLSPATKPDYYSEVMGIESEDFIQYQFPQPWSPTLTKLQEELFEISWWLWVEESDDIDWYKLISSWENPSEDPAWEAQALGEALNNYADQAEAEALPQMVAIRREWVEELQRLEEQAHTEHINDAYEDGAYYSLKFAEEALALTEEALQAIEEATPTRAEEEVKFYTKALEQMAIEAEDVPGMMVDDTGFMAGAMEDLKEIARRAHHDDIRAWEARGVQQEDAKLAIDRIRSHWAKRLEDMKDLDYVKKVNRLARKAHAGTVPNYRYKVGQMVKVKQSRRYGKIVGAKLEGGTGKQVYEVKVNGVDNPKKYYTDELEKAEQ